jgi:uncharacterized protein YcfJ
MENAVSKTKLMSPAGFLAVACSALAAGCATEPVGPTVQVYPAPNKPFEVFQGEQEACKQYASQQVAGQVDQANSRGVGETLVGAALGAGLGAAVGGGRGAGIGAAAGGVVGADAGAGSSENAQHRIQRQYNIAFSQCMYAKGNQVVGYRVYAPPPPVYVSPGYAPPPPPPGYYPPPPQ